jgi:uncharacterized protein YgbK (DUF1537 family)
MQICIIADDLTGAADTGIQFAKQGFHTILFPSGVLNSGFKEQVGVLKAYAVNTNTRVIEAESAYHSVRDTTKSVTKLLSPDMVYKKIDSTLRGNIGSEIRAVIDATGKDMAFVAPAFPACGRTTLNGVHLVNGKPVSETEASSDPVSPVTESYIPALLRSQFGDGVGHIDLRSIRFGENALRELILQRIKQGEKLIVFDAIKDHDLKIIARLGISMSDSPLMVGSAGLADQIAGLVGQNRTWGKHSGTLVTKSEGTIIIICGSLSKITSQQMDEVRKIRSGKIVKFEGDKLIQDVQQKHFRHIISQVISNVKSSRIIGLQSVKKDGKSSTEKVAECLGCMASEVIRSHPDPVAALILTGGDTAMAVFRNLGILQFRMMDELLPGVPYGEVIGGDFNGLNIVTKAGAFGDADTLVKCIDLLIDTNT